MNYKILALAIMGVTFIYDTFIKYLETKSAEREIPSNVADVYDEESYGTWLKYDKEVKRHSFTRHIFSSVLSFFMIGCNIYSGAVELLGVENMYWATFVVLAADTLLGAVVDLPFSYVKEMKIEQKYGFNRMTLKTFFTDEIRGALLSTLIIGGLLCLFACIHQALGNWLLIVFSIIMIVFALMFTFLVPVFIRLKNKLVPLEPGELRNRLMQLLEENDCTVRDIYTADGSKRSSRPNAFFGGYGKMKTIILYDTLLEQMTEDEILAVFAHEMGHNKHKDTLKSTFFVILQFVLWVVLIWGLVTVPEIYKDFGFDGVNYGFAFILMFSTVLSLLNPVLSLVLSFFSKKQEYAADRFTAERGYGTALVSALKKLGRNGFACLNPHPIVVALQYSHPTISQRVAAIEKVMKNH